MIRILKIGIFVYGLISVFGTAYVFLYYKYFKKGIVYYEMKNHFNKPHPLRPVFNYVYYPLRYYEANGRSFREPQVRQYYGWIEILEKGKEYREVSIKPYEGEVDVVRFYGNTKDLSRFDSIPPNKFLHVYLKNGFLEESSVVNADVFLRLLVDVKNVELMNDPRIKTGGYYSEEEAHSLRLALGSLKGDAKICFESKLKEYQDKVYEHCLQTGYMKNYASGCSYIYDGGYSDDAERYFLKECSVVAK